MSKEWVKVLLHNDKQVLCHKDIDDGYDIIRVSIYVNGSKLEGHLKFNRKSDRDKVFEDLTIEYVNEFAIMHDEK